MNISLIRTLKPSYNSLHMIGRIGYEATGVEYYLSLAQNISLSVQISSKGENFLYHYWLAVRGLENAVKDIDSFSFNLLNLDSGEKVPYLYNSLT